MGPKTEVAKRFRLEHQLGSGGMGTVWAATHLLTHKTVALKLLHKKNDDAEARRRVLREARAACAVRHPNVVPVHDVIEAEDGTFVLVMDLLQGESLADKLARERTLSAEEAVRIISPVLSALAAAHEVGVVHRDLKPDNIFLVGGHASSVKLLDFGIAKLSGTDGATKETSRLTETGAMIGTPHYMAPEQAFGESDIDARADLWAVGAVLYECLSGATPTSGQNLGQILKALASGTITPLAARAPEVPPALAAIVDTLLKIERDDRPKSARAVLEQLADVPRQQSTLESSAVRQREKTVPSLVSMTSPAAEGVANRRRPWFTAAATTLILASAAGFTSLRLRAASTSNVSTTAALAKAPFFPPVVPVEPAPSEAASASASFPISSVAVASSPPLSRTQARSKPVLPRPAPHTAESVVPAVKPSGGATLIVEPTF